MFIYILYNKYTQLTKIGITEDLNRRVSQLENSCGNDLIVVSYANINHAQQMESFLHATFANFRRRGEWFELGNREKQFLVTIWSTYFCNVISSNEEDPMFSYHIPVNEVIQHLIFINREEYFDEAA